MKRIRPGCWGLVWLNCRVHCKSDLHVTGGFMVENLFKKSQCNQDGNPG